MKHYILALLLLLLPMTGSAGDYNRSDTWFCRVVGTVEKEKIMFVTPLWTDDLDNHYTAREKGFMDHLQKATKNKFVPSFQAKCRDYVDADRAEKHRQLEMTTAKKYKFEVREVPWQWELKDAEKVNTK